MPCAVSPMNAAGVVPTTFSPKLLKSGIPGSGSLPDASSHLFTSTVRTAQRDRFVQRPVGSLPTTPGHRQIHLSASPSLFTQASEPPSSEQRLPERATEAHNISLALTLGRRGGLVHQSQGAPASPEPRVSFALCPEPQSRHRSSCENCIQLLPCLGPSDCTRRLVLGWAESSSGFLHKMLWKNPNVSCSANPMSETLKMRLTSKTGSFNASR